jgi:hypothetical protein
VAVKTWFKPVPDEGDTETFVGGGALTTNDVEAVCVIPAPLALITGVNVPGGVLALVPIVNVCVAVEIAPETTTLAGLKVAVAPVGRLLAL